MKQTIHTLKNDFVGQGDGKKDIVLNLSRIILNTNEKKMVA
jgi:hypothetical protein